MSESGYKSTSGFDARVVASLARLALNPEEVEDLGRDLAKILDYAAGLSSLRTQGVPPTTHPLATHADVRRPDTVREGLSREAAFAAAPATEDGLFRVPRIVGESSSA